MGKDGKRYDVIGIGVLVSDIFVQGASIGFFNYAIGRETRSFIGLEEGSKNKATIFINTGGSSANCAAALKFANPELEVGYFALLGRGRFSDALYNDLERRGIDVSGIIRRETFQPGTSIILTSGRESPAGRGRDRAILTDYGATDHLTEEDFASREEFLRSARWLDITSLKEEAVDPLIRFVEKLKGNHRGVNIFFAPSNSMIEPRKEAVKEMLKYADVLALNDLEAQYLIDEEDPEQAILKLQQKGPHKVFVTRGSKGILHYDGKTMCSITAFPVSPQKILNTTGAGDVVASKFLEGLIKRQDPDTILLRAAAAGAIKVQSKKVGAKEGFATNEDIDKFLAANRDRVTIKSYSPKLKRGV